MKENGLFMYALAVTLLFTVAGCDVGSDSKGGGGADFDSSMYYTKSEVDEKIAELIAETYSDEDIDEAIDFATPTRGTNSTGGPSTSLNSTNNSYANGVSLGNPSGVTFVMLVVDGYEIADGNGFYIVGGCSTETNPRKYTIPADDGGSKTSVKGGVYLFHVHGSDMKFWVEGLDDASTSVYINSVWFRDRNE
ncbi:MAG: hypothetical protein ACOC2H_02610 [Spirochaetota bacterium]